MHFHFISTTPLSFVQQVVFKNVGPVERQYPPGVNVTSVGVDVYVEGAAMQCYRDMSTSFAADVCISVCYIEFCHRSNLLCRVAARKAEKT